MARAAESLASNLFTWVEEAQQEVLDKIDRFARQHEMTVTDVESVLKAQGEHDLASAWLEYCEDWPPAEDEKAEESKEESRAD